jgi:4-oxalocrotonate tautomerase
MPLIEVSLAQGRSEQQIRTMIHEVHEAVLRSIDTKPEYIRVIVREVPRTHWATGDVTLSELRSRHDADPKLSGTKEES